MITDIVTFPGTTDLVSLQTVKNELGEASEVGDERLERLIAEASAMIGAELETHLARRRVVEIVQPYGPHTLRVWNQPLVQVHSVTMLDGFGKLVGTVDPDAYYLAAAGYIYHRASAWLGTRSHDSLDPVFLRGPETHNYRIDYTHGYLMAGDDVSGVTTISASVTDNSFNDSGNGFPILVPGDKIVVEGFETAGNNGAFKVVTATTSKLTVSGGTLVNEVAGQKVNVTVQTLPLDLERAALDLVKGIKFAETRDPAIKRTQTVDVGSTEYAVSTDASGAAAVLRHIRPILSRYRPMHHVIA